MKRYFFSYLSLLILMLSSWQASAWTQVVDIRTGIYNYNNQQIADGAQDDNWEVQVPGGSGFQPTLVGYPNQWSNVYAPPNTTAAKWVYPGPGWLQQSGGGVFLFRYRFYISVCDVQSATLNLNLRGADNTMDLIQVNGASFPVVPNVGFCSTCGITPFQNGGPASISLPSGTIVNGWNTVTVQVNDWGVYTGIFIDGNVTIQSSSQYLDFGFKDKNGADKVEFCIGEDVFFNALSVPTGIYYLDLSEVINGTPNLITTQPYPLGWTNGNPHNVNISALFENHPQNPVTFQPGKIYQLKLKVTAPCEMTLTKTFTFKCCDNSTNPKFWVAYFGNRLEAYGEGKGTHQWNVYYIPNGNNGTYVHIGTVNGPSLALTIADNAAKCFYIQHTITTPCGYACNAQIVCKSDCDEKECNMTTPVGSYNASTREITWSAVPGATYYMVQVIANDPACCPTEGGGGGGMSSNQFHSYIVSGTSFVVPNPQEGNLNDLLTCFSWRIVAVCPDGGTTASAYKCSNGSGGGDPLGKRATTGMSAGGNKSEKKMDLAVFPNPSTGMFTVDVTTPVDVAFSMTLTDVTGRTVRLFDGLKTVNGKASVKWMSESLGKGVYIVKITLATHEEMTRKLIVE